ncbi:myophilin-like isoform X2 [Saccoglossus kowalevskii]|uniref:Myophilin-like isoform X2 n=1 Tax=Saccoglossus kowalevskii TaxID=10224 RepID=A0ABM0M648_SACKO|nr:PREDICTED: myophilin-like isoform X2 [Saccoglossus kowalevskii]
MATRGPSYGMSAQVAAKIGAKRDPQQEAEVQEWIETLTGEKFPSDYAESLRDGIILCKLANTLVPGSVKKVNTNKTQSFKLRENIENFQKMAKNYGVPETDVFQVVDLFEKSNISQVTQCICAVGRLAQTKPGYTGPALGPKQSAENVREWTEEQLLAQKQMKGEIGLQMGQNKGASQAGQNFGLGRQINYTEPQ